MTYIFHPLAAKELEEELAHYLSVGPDLALRFLTEVESAIDRILAYPKRMAEASEKYTSVPANAF